jgi:uncharacterized protein (TIGR02266 family)
MTAAKVAVNEYAPRGPRAEAEIKDLAAPDSASDRRRVHPRCSVDLDVSLGSEHNFYAGLAENLSAGGVFVATHMLKPVGEIIEVTVHFSDSDRVVKATGEVRWVREYNESNDVPPGMGIRWTNLSEEDSGLVENFATLRPPLFFDEDE